MKLTMDKTRTHFYYKGIKVNVIDLDAIQHLVEKIVAARGRAYFCMTDAGNVIMAQKDAQLASAINQSTLSIADGTPLAWFGRLTGRKKVQRISGVDLFQQLLHHSDFSHFLLGDTVDMHNKIIATAKEIKPDIRIKGFSPPFKDKFSAADNRLIMKEIKNVQPDIVWVSFGGGKQEKWMLENAANLDSGIMIGVGAAFKYYIGDLTIPHPVIQRLGLQWTTRLSTTPKRWLFQGPFKRLVLFSMNFPYEFLKAKYLNRS